MALQYQADLLSKVEDTFKGDGKRYGKISDFIMALQGSGHMHINVIVNDLVFLRRELMNAHPNEQTVQRLLASLYQRTTKTLNDSPDYTPVLKNLRAAIIAAAK